MPSIRSVRATLTHKSPPTSPPYRAPAAEGGGEAAGGGDALQEMGTLNTARIRKAVDPKVLDVKKRVRQARRGLKRESKVQLSDEIIFFDDVAGNEQVGSGDCLPPSLWEQGRLAGKPAAALLCTAVQGFLETQCAKVPTAVRHGVGVKHTW